MILAPLSSVSGGLLGGAIGSLTNHCVERVNNSKNSRYGRYLVTAQAEWIATSVNPFVVL